MDKNNNEYILYDFSKIINQIIEITISEPM